MLNGLPPFYNAKNTELMYQMIRKSELKFSNKVKISDDAKDLITKLLNKKQSLRLGKNEGFKEIREHAFFKGVDFDAILNKKIPAPFVPQIGGKLDIHNFDECFTSEDIQMTQMDDSALNYIKKKLGKFKDFDIDGL